MRCRLAATAAGGAPGRIRTSARFGPSSAGTGPLLKAVAKALGNIWNANSTPVPMDVWSETVLANPMAGNVAVPTIRSRVGGTQMGASAGSRRSR